MRGWLESWLGYLKWWLFYFRLVNNYLDYNNPSVRDQINRVSIDDVWAAPIVSNSWRLSNRDVVSIRYSLLQRIKELLDQLPPFLEIGSGGCLEMHVDSPYWCVCTHPSYMLVGTGDNAFLVSSKGLVIPLMIRCTGCICRKKVQSVKPSLLSRL